MLLLKLPKKSSHDMVHPSYHCLQSSAVTATLTCHGHGPTALLPRCTFI